MGDTFLTTTSTAGLQPLGSAAQRSYELVSGTVRQRLGDAHAALFAEPVASAHGEAVDWYAAGEGTAIALSDLPEDEARDVKATLGSRVAEISALAETLRGGDAADDRRLAETLANAIEVPDEAMIYALRRPSGELQPVLVHWSWLRDDRQAVRGILTAMVPRAVPLSVADRAAAAEAAAARPLWGGWWWLVLLGWVLLALMLAAILYLLIAPCGLRDGRLLYCPEDPEGYSAVETEHAVIRDRIARLQHDLAIMDRGCRATIPVKPAPAPEKKTEAKPPYEPPPDPDRSDAEPNEPTGEDPAEGDVTQRLTDRGAALGALNFTLEWSTKDDIDLLVTCPGGQTLSYKNRADCGGVFDLDANVDRDTAVDDPVENIRFEDVTPGLYKVSAELKGNRTDGDKRVTLHVLRRDGRSQRYSGRVGAGTPVWTINLSISG